MILPRLAREWALWRDGARRIAGVDEVGMACLAGPVVAAAVIMRPHCHKIPGVRDSKTVPQPERERLYPLILKRAVAVGVGAASVDEINRLNILRASHLAMRRALRRVAPYDYVLVDGRDFADFVHDFGPHAAIVDGDAKCYSIACASIVAKVTRDRLMARLAVRRPGYGWEQNVGYPTPEHRRAIHAQGITPHHRRSFGTVRVMLQPSLGLDGLGPVAADPSELEVVATL